MKKLAIIVIFISGINNALLSSEGFYDSEETQKQFEDKIDNSLSDIATIFDTRIESAIEKEDMGEMWACRDILVTLKHKAQELLREGQREFPQVVALHQKLARKVEKSQAFVEEFEALLIEAENKGFGSKAAESGQEQQEENKK